MIFGSVKQSSHMDAMGKPQAETELEKSFFFVSQGRRWNFDAWLLCVAVLSFLMCIPFLRTVYGLGDEGELLNGAERILHGETLYDNFFEFLPPGGFFLTAWWFGIAGGTIVSARSLGILVIVGVACFAYLANRQATRNAPVSAALTVFWVAASQGHMMTQLSHHWFTTLFSMTAFWVTLVSLQHPKQGLWGAFVAGLTEGAAVMVTPTCGALAWLAPATTFVRQRRIEFSVYLAASAVTPVFFLVYLIAHHDLTTAYADCIRFSAGHYASIQGVPFGFGVGLQTYPIVILFPIAGLLTVFVCFVDGQSCLNDRRLQLCIAFAAAGFIGCFPRPDVGRLVFATPLGLPLFAYCINNLAQRCRPIIAALLGELLIAFCLPSAIMFGLIAKTALYTPLMSTPRGDISLIGLPGASEMLGRLAAMPAGDNYFFYPYIPLMSFLTGLEQVSKYEIFAPGYMLPSQYQDACLSVMQHADWVVIDRQWTPIFWKKSFPAMQNPKPRETLNFEDALKRGFSVVAKSGTFELRHRNANASVVLCTGIAD